MPLTGERRRDQRGLVHQIALLLGISALSGVLVAGLLVPLAGLISIGAKRSADAADGWPLRLHFEKLSQRSQVYAAGGSRIATFYDENRVYVPLHRIAPQMRQAVVAVEDKNFREHGALDIRGTLRALVVNKTSDNVIQGGSTITQQLVKLTLLSQAHTAAERRAATAKNYERKILEWRYATWVEEHLTKSQILEHYLNAAYFGQGAYGIQAAARHYFEVDASQLNLKQSALLAGLVKNPVGFDPSKFPAQAKDRRDTVIDLMYQQHLITEQDKTRIDGSPLGLHLHFTPSGCLQTRFPFFCDYVEKYLLASPILGKTRADRKEVLFNGGLRIHTSIDMRYQRALQGAVNSSVYSTDHAIGVLTSVQPGTGYVKGMAQSRPMGNSKKKGDSFINYAVPPEYGGGQGFQAGSTFKLFVLAAAIRQGIPLHYSIDAPQVLNKRLDYQTCNGHVLLTSPVPTSTTSGRKDLYTGTQQSVNPFYMLLEQKTGLCAPFRLAKRMGVDPGPAYTHHGANGFMVPTFTLGVSAVSPLEMAEAYATVAARGMHCKATPIVRIFDSSGKAIQTGGPKCNRVLKKTQADAINDILKGVQEPGGFGYQYGDTIQQVSAAKTGTTNNAYSVWFMGYTPNLVTAAMVAGDNSRGLPTDLDFVTLAGRYVAGNAHGSTLAGGMWAKAMRIIAKYLPNAHFVPPSQDTINGNAVQLQSYYGYSAQSAASALARLGLRSVISPYRVTSGAPIGTVAYVSPSYALKGDTVTIYLSNGPPPQPQPKPQKPQKPNKPGPHKPGGPGDGGKPPHGGH
jgi:membrane peptidoglycan carboxypeptidase